MRSLFKMSPQGSASLSRRVSILAAATAALMLFSFFGFGMWAASRIDAHSLEKQVQAIATGVSEIADRTQVEQDSSVQWDDAVEKLRAGDDAWLADNLAEWMSQYFGHDRVYLLDASDHVIRAVEDGQRVSDERYNEDRSAIDPLVQQLRAAMANASFGQTESTQSVTGMGTLDRAVLGDGTVGIVSVRPIVPTTDAVKQAPGTEFLHVSVRLFDSDLSTAIATKYGLESLHFDRISTEQDGYARTPITNSAGRILGFFAWRPFQPAMQLIKQTTPLAVLFSISAALLVALLLRRLLRTSAQLELSESQARYLAFHDPLARIPNRALFQDRLERAVAAKRHAKGGLALHAIDLDRFKQVNDSLGHPAGDELIRQVARRLQSLISEVDTVARVGGDEFSIVQVDVRDVGQALMLSSRIVSELEKPFDLDGHDVLVSASVGVVFAGADESAVDSEDLQRKADIALYEAKTSGRGRYQLHAGELDVAVNERRSLERDLRAALNGEAGLELVYQPIFEATSHRITGAEALVRWNNPRRGRLSPDAFIGLAEERGLIDQLGLWVLREACNFAIRSEVPWIAVNVSPAQFVDERFADRVMAVLHDVGLAPRRLELEITEGLLLQNSMTVQSTLRKLRAAGIRVALDDFGTGYSSISYLRSHGVDKLKIDQSFVAKLGHDAEIDSIVVCIIGLAKAMHMRVTAEGVETEEQRATLQSIGCNELQGYLMSRPVTGARMNELLTETAAGTKNVSAA